jgi:hypothetical protein
MSELTELLYEQGRGFYRMLSSPFCFNQQPFRVKVIQTHKSLLNTAVSIKLLIAYLTTVK